MSLPTAQSYGGILSVGVPSSQIILAWVTVDITVASTELCLHVVEGAKWSSGVSSIRKLVSMRVLPSRHNHHAVVSSSNVVALGARMSTEEFWEDVNNQSIYLITMTDI